jgi:hypothetical protein
MFRAVKKGAGVGSRVRLDQTMILEKKQGAPAGALFLL